MDQLRQYVEQMRRFSKDSIRLLRRCTRLERFEIYMIAIATGISVLTLGFCGFFVKLLFIPINNMIVGPQDK